MAQRMGLALAIGGTLVAAIGVGLVVNRRRQLTGAGLGLGRGGRQAAVERRRVGGMTVTVYTDRSMPIEMRAGLIQDLVRDGVKDGDVRDLAHAIVGSGTKRVRVGKYMMTVTGANCAPGDARCKADAIGRFTAANVRYSGDIAPVKMGRHGPVEPVDYFQSAQRTLEAGGGDCDDNDATNCTLLEEVQVPCHHRITAPRPSSDWSHIYTMADIGGGNLVALDSTLPGYRTGKEAQHARRVDFPAMRGR